MEKKTLYTALAAAQAEFNSALKDADNPFFKSKYADLAAVWNACKDAVAKHGLFVSQQPGYTNEANCWVIHTKVYDTSGEFIESTTPIITAKQNDPQSFGAAMTYTRRYSLAATLGIIVDDDDAEGAMNRQATKAATKVDGVKPANVPLKATEIQKDKIRELVEHEVISPDEAQKAHSLLTPELAFEVAAAVIARLKQIIDERTAA